MPVTLLDIAKRLDPDGKIAAIAELLTKTNEILVDMPFKEGNLPTGHRVTMRTGLPEVFFRTYNQGIPTSKSSTAQFDEQCAMLEARCEVDKDLADLNGNTAEFRLSEAVAYIESMNQKMAQTVFYGNAALNPEEFTGLSIRYSSLSATNGVNILNAGGTGSDNTSIWLIAWGENTVFGIYPKASKVGIQHENLGIIDALDANGRKFRAYADWWQWKVGLALKDWRYVVRIANIDVSDLVGMTGTQALSASTHIIKLMARALHRLPNTRLGNPVFYVNRTVASHLTLHAMEKTTSVLSIQPALTQFGESIYELKFLNVPIRICDSLVENESVVA